MTTPRPRLSRAGQTYVTGVCAAGIVVVLHSLFALTRGSVDYRWFVLAGLTLLSGSFTVRIPTIPARLSVSETFVFTAAILFGPAAATVIVVLDSLIISLWLKKSSRRPSRVLFNMAAPAIAIWVATQVFFVVAEAAPLYQAPRPILSLVFPLLILALLYFLLNSGLIAGAVGFEKNLSPFSVWRENFLWLSLNYFSGASVAALLLPYFQSEQQAFLRIAGILLPLLLISYLTFKTALGRVDDAHRHLNELNSLYLSTIETLAMAIDAKDQITHGHIRRVQHHAVALAGKMGITDPAQIKAIEAASLLHDMGKLAVPEYILNKPGKLTPAEFEKMKLHASVGADILSAIAFPYPVVPIVRHHHENWDGTGYPDRVRGSDIPIGARILSVVDCFDALTSDRPYRPKLTDQDAINILVERRGTMYDPLVVDTFIRAHSELTQGSRDNPQHSASPIAAGLRSEDLSTPGASGLDDIASSAEEMVVLFDLARVLPTTSSVTQVGDLVAQHLRRIVPAASVVFYIYDSTEDDVSAAFAAGEHSGHFVGLRIPRGERLSGWVAANKQSILNSDPVLDLGEIARGLRPRLRNCLSTPLIQDAELVGVMSLYSADARGFTENHRRVAELVARQIAPSLRAFAHKEEAETGKLNARLSGRGRVEKPDSQGQLSIALIQIGGSPSGDPSVQEAAVARLARLIRSGLRGQDVLFQHQPNQLIALLGGATSDAASQVTQRISDALRQRGIQAEGIDIRIGTASTPDDGASIDTLIAVAERRGTRLDAADDKPRSIH
jgi:putative nucleotidyltransferase with HDIG domain